MRAAVRKWKAVFGIYFQDGLAYRASGIIWILTDLVTAITMPLVWASASGGGSIAGFGSSDFVAYYLALFAINSFVTSHIMWELAMEIREGRFTVFLLRPISFYWFTFLRNLSWRILRTAFSIPFLLVLLFAYRSFLADVTIQPTWEFWAALAGGHLVSITFVLMMSMIALFTQEAQSIFELYYVPMSFLSGYLFPIALLPEWARSLAHFFPFYYTTGAPTEILLGRMDRAGAHNVLLIQAAWIVGCYLAAQVLWKKGLRHYTAIGM
jgi:ABC-2 type transport system permease protein